MVAPREIWSHARRLREWEREERPEGRAGEVDPSRLGEVEEGVAVVELEQRVGDVAGGEGLGGDLDGAVLAGRVEEEDGVAELDGDGLGPADVDVRLCGGRRPPRVQPANLVRRRRGAAGHGHGHEEEQQRRQKQKQSRHAHPLLCFSAQAPDAQHQRASLDWVLGLVAG